MKQCLDKRFADSNGNVLQATMIANLSMWPESEHLREFGDESIQILSDHWSPVLKNADVNIDELQVEWYSLKMTLSTQNIATLNWQTINKNHGSNHKNIYLA